MHDRKTTLPVPRFRTARGLMCTTRMKHARGIVILFTVVIVGIFTGSGVAQLAAARAMPLSIRPLPLPVLAPTETPAVPIPDDEPAHPPPPPPRVRPACPSYRLVGTFLVRGAPERSFAAVQTSAGSTLISPSMSLDGVTVEAIEPDRLVLGDCEPAGSPEPQPSIAAPPEDELVTELAPNHYRITREAIASGEHARLRAIPDANGVRIYGVRRGSLAARMGLSNGDRITTVDGQPVTSVDAAMDAYARALSGNPVRITIERRGQPIEVVVELAP